MEIVDFSSMEGDAVTHYGSVATRASDLAHGSGDAHVRPVRFEPGGSSGEHPTGLGQLFVGVEGRAWVSGEEGRRVELAAGQGAHLRRGERHAKGSDHGATAIMIQVRDLELRRG